LSNESERMYNLFRGSELGHGTYEKEEKQPGKQKSEIKGTAKTLRGEATIAMWDKHLAGNRSLGIIPVRTDGTCNWGVIDIDNYNLSHREIVEKTRNLGLPLVLCRSKSGGAHLFLFTSEFVPAGDMIDKLRELAAVMGYGGSEIFPKQVTVDIDRGDLGNWLNMPYFKADGGNRYSVDGDGKGLSLYRFLEVAEKSQITHKQLLNLAPKLDKASTDLADGPPCLETLSVTKVAEGGRNNALFAYGILAKKMRPDNWEPLLEEWNYKFLVPPLSTDEVGLVLRQLRKKEYFYKCKEPPICNHCDKMVCQGRRFGIGTGGIAPAVDSIAILDSDPKFYFVRLDSGETINADIDDILSPIKFQKTVLSQIDKLLPIYKRDTWLRSMQQLIDTAVHIEPPDETMTRRGMFKELWFEFLTDRFAAKTFDEIIMGKPFFDEETREYQFRYRDLEAYLTGKKFVELNRNEIVVIMKEFGAYKLKYKHFKGVSANVWSLPEAVVIKQEEPFDTPRIKDSPV